MTRAWLRDVRGLWRRLGTIELAVLVPVLLITLAIWGFAELGDEVLEGGTAVFDRAVLAALREPGRPDDPVGGPLVESSVRDLTSLGSLAVLTLFTLAALGYLLLRGKRRLALYMVAAIVGGALLSFALKGVFGRPRPAQAGDFPALDAMSFPSGHAFMSTVVYLTAGALVAASTSARWARAYILAVAAALSVIVGLTRIYLGVHWETDVAAGWAAGAAWALLCWVVARLLQQKGEIEPAEPAGGEPAAPEPPPPE